MLVNYTYEDTTTIFGAGHYKSPENHNFDTVRDYTSAEKQMIEKIKATEGINDDHIFRIKFPDPNDSNKETIKADARNIRVIFSLPKNTSWKQQVV